MKKAEFPQMVQQLGIILDDDQLSKFARYHFLLQEWNAKMNLTGIDDEEGVYEKHFYDSLLSAKEICYDGKLADVGSGAGFPGIVLKIAFNDLDVVLIEPLRKRCVFLQTVIDELDLKGISVVNARSEEYARKLLPDFDIVTARAVANLNVLSELCIPLLKTGGRFVILRGASGHEEIADAKSAFKKLNSVLISESEFTLPDSSKRVIAVVEKIKATDKRYPRNYGDIKKRPL